MTEHDTADLLERFLRYVRIATQSDESSTTQPSTACQLDLARLLRDECRELGLQDVTLNEQGVVLATVPSTIDAPVPAIAWLAHVDTSPETTGHNVQPQVHRNYDGCDIRLPSGDGLVLRVADNPPLGDLIGSTIVTTDGSTLLGGDDKAGIAVIMTAAARLLQDTSIVHGPIRICFTCDEEIGRGTNGVDLEQLNAVCAYTLDGDGRDKIDCETFSADQATVTVHGVNTHPSIGKGTMVNACRILGEFLAQLPTDRLAPEVTDGREGFVHPYQIEGGVACSTARLILRDFETERLEEQADLLRQLATELQDRHPGCRIEVTVRSQYRNLRDGLAREPRVLDKAVEAIRATGREPVLSIIRGGTDGSLLTAQGLPTPNLSTGQHNPHSPLEWASVSEMQQAVAVLLHLARAWGSERIS